MKLYLRFTIILFFASSYSQSILPDKFELDEDSILTKTFSLGLKSNSISEIVFQGDSKVWLGTGRGISYLVDSVSIYTLDTLLLNTGNTYLMYDGISGIANFNDHIMFAGASGDELGDFGTGIFYNDGSGEWVHHAQPTEYSEESSILQPIGNGYFEMLPITTHYSNISYDLSVTQDYAWITSWAGGLRRIELDSLRNDNAQWFPIPLPEDDQLNLFTCDENIFDDSLNVIAGYFLNPRDPFDGGNHNHKAFSVISYSDTVWVGTANGINRGILGENGCIDWDHYSFHHHNLSGNFVVGLEYQNWNNHRIIWAASMNANNPGEQRGVSYTIDDGENWQTTLIGERVYNISAMDSLVLVSSESGLWKTIIHYPNDPLVWAKYEPMVERTEYYNLEILSNGVFTAVADNRPYLQKMTLWAGTSDGLAKLNSQDGMNWKIYRTALEQNSVFAYPNPFSPSVDNVVNGDGYVRFSTGSQVIEKANMFIYSFAMEEVLSQSFDVNINTGELKWNGKDNLGKSVSNGVYFVNLELSEGGKWSEHWMKVIVVQ